MVRRNARERLVKKRTDVHGQNPMREADLRRVRVPIGGASRPFSCSRYQVSHLPWKPYARTQQSVRPFLPSSQFVRPLVPDHGCETPLLTTTSPPPRRTQLLYISETCVSASARPTESRRAG